MKIQKKLLFLIIFIGLVFVITSFYNYYTNRAIFKNSGPSVTPTISLITPLNQTLNQPVELIWTIDTPTPRRIISTTVYYSPVSTPSAVTVNDPPQALGYQYSLPDYQNGDFESPQIFKARLFPPKDVSTLFLRGYAFIDQNHYWTDEIKLELK